MVVGERAGQEWEVIIPRVTRFDVVRLADGTLGLQPHQESAHISWQDLPKIPGTPSEFVHREDLGDSGIHLPERFLKAAKKGASHATLKSDFRSKLRLKK